MRKCEVAKCFVDRFLAGELDDAIDMEMGRLSVDELTSVCQLLLSRERAIGGAQNTKPSGVEGVDSATHGKNPMRLFLDSLQ